MSEHPSVKRSTTHEEVAALLPWYVNETLSDGGRERVEAHLRDCPLCRADLAVEQRIRADMSTDGPLEFMPAASLNRLRGMLDREAADVPEVVQPLRSGRSRRWQWLVAASFAGALAGAGILTAGHKLADGGVAPYHTVTDNAPRSRDEVVRAVFVPTITLVELQALLDEAQLRIVSGPTEAGVYSLAAKSSLPVSTSLALLRRHRSVRFAESIEPVGEASNSP